MKKIIFLFIIIISTFVIYKVTVNKKIYVLSLGDFLALGVNDKSIITYGYNNYIETYLSRKDMLKNYNKDFIVNNYHTTDLINDILINKEVSTTLQNSLIKADLTIISIGNNDLIFELQGTNNLDEIISDYDKLFDLVRKYTKEEVIVNSLYYPYDIKVDDIDEKVIYMNEKLNKLCKKYNFIYNDIYDIVQGNYPTNDNYEKIGESIVKKSFLHKI